MNATKCLSLETLSRYIGGLLPDDEAQTVEAHLADCDSCLDEFMMATELLNDLPPEQAASVPRTPLKDVAESIVASVQGTVQQAAQQVLRTLSEWKTAIEPPVWALQTQVRSTAATAETPFFYVRDAMDNVIVEMYAEWSTSDNARLFVKPFVDEKPVSGVKVAVKREGGGRSIRKLLDENDYFLKENLSFGVFELTISDKTEVLGRRRFEINEEGIHERFDSVPGS
jgi:anti-sigma factor RsiW